MPNAELNSSLYVALFFALCIIRPNRLTNSSKHLDEKKNIWTNDLGPFGRNRSVDDTLELDQKNGNNLWKEAMEKELAQLDQFKVFRLQKPGESLDGYEWLPYHVVWDCSVTLIIVEKLV